MAIAVDASSPARVNLVSGGGGNDDPTGTTASFSPPSGAILLCSMFTDTNAGTTPTSNVTSSSSESWTKINERGASEGTGGYVTFWITAAIGTSARTVTGSITNMGVSRISADDGSMKVWVLTDALFTWGAIGENSSTTNNYTASAILTGVLSTSLVFGCGEDWNALGSPTSSDLTINAMTNGFISGLHGYKAAGGGGSISMNFDASGSSAADWNVCAVEIQQASGGGGTPACRKVNVAPTSLQKYGGMKAYFQGGLWLPGRCRPVSMYQPKPVLARKELLLPAWAKAA